MRLIDELVALDVEQIVLVSATAETRGARTPSPGRDSTDADGSANTCSRPRRPRSVTRLMAARTTSLRLFSCDRPTIRSDRSTSPAASTIDRIVASTDRADGARLRRRLPPVHRSGGRAERRARWAVASTGQIGQVGQVRRERTARECRGGLRPGRDRRATRQFDGARRQCNKEARHMSTSRMHGPATQLIHAGQVTGDVHPLTTPIYETTTFVFENAAEVVAFNEGRSSKYPVLALRESDRRQRRAEAGRARRGGGGAAVFVRAWGRRRRADGAHRAGDEVVCAARHLRRHAAPAARSARALRRSRPRSCPLESLADPERVIGPTHEGALVRVADQSDAPLRRRPRVAAACRARGVLSVIDNTFASPINQQPLALGVDLAMQSATKYLNGHSDVTGGVRDRLAGTVEPAGAAAAAARHHHGSRAGVRARPRAEDAAASNRAPQRQRAGGGRVSRGRSRGSPASTTRDCRRIPITTIARRQMTGFGGMVCFDLGRQLRSRGSGATTGSRSSSARPASAASRASSACRCSRRSGATPTSSFGRRASRGACCACRSDSKIAADIIADLDQALG